MGFIIAIHRILTLIFNYPFQISRDFISSTRTPFSNKISPFFNFSFGSYYYYYYDEEDDENGSILFFRIVGNLGRERK